MEQRLVSAQLHIEGLVRGREVVQAGDDVVELPRREVRLLPWEGRVPAPKRRDPAAYQRQSSLEGQACHASHQPRWATRSTAAGVETSPAAALRVPLPTGLARCSRLSRAAIG